MKKKQISIRRALSICTVVSVLVFGVASCIVAYTTSEMVTENMRATVNELFAETQQNINSELATIETISTFSMYQTGVDVYLYAEEDEIDTMADWYTDLMSVLTLTCSQYSDIHSIGIFRNDDIDGLYVGRTASQSVYQTTQLLPQSELLDSSPTSSIWLEPFELNYSTYDLFSFQAKILDMNTLEYSGTLIINVKTEALTRIMKQSNMGGIFFIIDENNSVLLESDSFDYQLITDELGNLSENNYHNTVQTIAGEDYIISQASLSAAGWSLVGITPLESMQSDIYDNQIILLITSLMSMVLLITFSIFLANKISKPIVQLTSKMDSVKEGNFKASFYDDSFTETKQLSEGFNQLLQDIDELLVKNYEQQITERDIRLELLQAKINPHFLYNTLENIRYISLREGNAQAAELITSLSDLMRYSISSSSTSVFLYQELEYVRNYLFLQTARFSDRFTFQFNIEEELLDCKIMKMLVQPIVENAVLHGLENKPEDGKLVISAYSLDDYDYEICVEDNGVGMSETQLEQLDARLNSVYPQGEKHIGVCNVQHRIRLQYGTEYGVTYSSELDKGTRVQLRLPKKEG